MQINDMKQQQKLEFYEQMEEAFKVNFLPLTDKRIQEKMDYIDAFLPIKTDISKRPFSLGKLIGLPFNKGTRNSFSREAMIIVHECVHSQRMADSGFIEWQKKYFTDKVFRALEESSAQEAENEFMFWYTGSKSKLDLDDGYFLDDVSLELVRSTYAAHSNLLHTRGQTFHYASRTAIDLLQDEFGVLPL